MRGNVAWAFWDFFEKNRESGKFRIRRKWRCSPEVVEAVKLPQDLRITRGLLAHLPDNVALRIAFARELLADLRGSEYYFLSRIFCRWSMVLWLFLKKGFQGTNVFIKKSLNFRQKKIGLFNKLRFFKKRNLEFWKFYFYASNYVTLIFPSL